MHRRRPTSGPTELTRPSRKAPRRSAAAGLAAAVLGAGVAAAAPAAAVPVRAASPAVATTTDAAQLSVFTNTTLSRDVYQGGIANTVLLTRGNGTLYAYARHERAVTDANLAILLAPGNARGQAQFLWAWNRLAYGQTIYALAVNRRAPNAALKAYAIRYIAGAEREVALAVSGLVPGVSPTAFAYTLSRTDTLARWSTDLLGAGLPLQYVALEAAALSVTRLGIPLSAAIAAQRHVTGSLTTAGAQVNLALGLLFQAHVYQTGIASYTGFTFGQFTGAYAGATTALDINTVQIGLVVRALFGAAPGSAFISLWTSHTHDYALYQAGLIARDLVTVGLAAKYLGEFIAGETAQLHGLVPAVSTATLQDALNTHVGTTIGVILLQAQNNARQFALTTAGANHFVGVAYTLAQAIIAEKHLPASVTPQVGQALNRAYDTARAAAK